MGDCRIGKQINMKNRERKKLATRLDIGVFIGLTFFTLLILIMLGEYTEISYLYNGMICLFFYLIMLVLWADIRIQRKSLTVAHTLDDIFNTEVGRTLVKMKAPTVLCDTCGTIIWCNDSFEKKTGHKRVTKGVNIEEIMTLGLFAEDGAQEGVVVIGEESFRVDPIPCTLAGEDYWFIVLDNCTALLDLQKKYDDGQLIIAYAIIDNIDEIVQYVRDDYIETTNTVENKLKKWVAGMDGIIRPYERNKYIIAFEAKKLPECLASRFSILDEIREIRVGDGISITVSLGVSDVGDTFAEREIAAQNALDMALMRGGDQAVYKSAESVEYFGGRTKAGFKRTNVRARVTATQLTAMMARADNVLVMGHRFGDYDSFAASVGMARFARNCSARVNIVVNKDDPNLQPCFEKLESVPFYQNIFVDGAEGMDLLTNDTLLIIVDVNNLDIVECPELAMKANNIAVIDHHIKAAEYGPSVKLEYIETSASSASELVSEFLELNMASRNLHKEECELLLSGILLDTKQFTRNTGTRTFAVAQFLRGEGANPGETQEMFKSDIDELTKEARFNANITIYRKRIAISSCEGNTDSSYRVMAAKVADKLLNIKNVDASFVLVNIDNRIHISARSNGTINVQVILEKLNGGGHFDVAGAQISNDTMRNVVQRLRDAIDDNLDNV
jgi:c-di-AMP phosphodiesterase-like protein